MHAQGNAEAASKFQEAQKAYETLRDPEKRRMYDTVGPEGMDRGMGGGGSGAEGMGGFGFGFPGGGGFAAVRLSCILLQSSRHSTTMSIRQHATQQC